MAKARKKRRKKSRKPTLAQLKERLENLKERNPLLKARALGQLNGQAMTKRNRKRQKDAKNHWSRDWE